MSDGIACGRGSDPGRGRNAHPDLAADVRKSPFGGALRALRLAALLTQEELAERAGVSARTVANMEAGRVLRPHSRSVGLLADALGLSGVDKEAFGRSSRSLAPPEDAAAAAAAPAAQVPASVPLYQVPIVPRDFIGRPDEASRVAAHLTAVGSHPPVAVITGPGGIGKTALMLHVAHGLVDEFPDGQLFADLGSLEHALDPADVLGWFLRSLGVDGAAVPGDRQERAALYRSLLATRRVLVVLDNATDERQVRPLLPGMGACATVITSRRRLEGLEASVIFDLELFSAQTSLALLGKLISPARIHAEADSARAIVDSCGGLPLAVRIAGARLAGRPTAPLASFARALADERRRLDHLRAGDLEVRASVELGYTALREVDRRALRLLAVTRPGSFSAWVLAPLLDVDRVRAEAVVRRLVEGRLVDVVGADITGEPRYRCHDLVRLFAVERAERDESPDLRRAALARALGCWLTLTELVVDALPTTRDVPTEGDAERRRPPAGLQDHVRAEPQAWFQQERHNLLAAVEVAAAHGLHGHAWQLASAMNTPAVLFCHLETIVRSQTAALGACREAGDRQGEAAAITGLARAEIEKGSAVAAVPLLRRAASIFASTGDRHGEAFAIIQIANAHVVNVNHARDPGRPLDEALTLGHRGVALASRLGDRLLYADATAILGDIYRLTGDLDAAEDHFARALEICQERGKGSSRAHAVYGLGRVALAGGRLEPALAAFQEALEITRNVGDRRGVAYVTCTLAEATLAAGDRQGAIKHLEHAIVILDELRIRDKHEAAVRMLAAISDPSRPVG